MLFKDIPDYMKFPRYFNYANFAEKRCRENMLSRKLSDVIRKIK